MDWVDSFNSGKPSKEERRIHIELTTLYECPACRVTTHGLRPFSDHKRHCKPFSSWLTKHSKKYSARRAELAKVPIKWLRGDEY